MSEFFEIAYAVATHRLCLFTGTGFSKAVTDNVAPSWQGLLESIIDLTKDPAAFKAALFPPGVKNPLSLEEAAQVIAIELQKSDRSIHHEIAEKIKTLSPSGDNKVITEFLSTRFFRVVTTNYDKLLENLAGEADCHSLTPGLPIPRSQSRVKIYHVHGSVDSPENMVVTSDDYFKFINGESYFSRKLSTVLHENTVVILGYSLGDTNLKAIISDYKGFSRSQVIGSNLFLVSRSKVDQHVKDYYAHCYGIRVLDQLSVHDFFSKLNAEVPAAEKCASESIKNIKQVVCEGKRFTEDYLKLENSFFEIISSIAAAGFSVNDSRVVTALGKIIETKTKLTQENNAWPQYVHLAKWLIYLASILELKGTSIEGVFLEATRWSMTTMRRENYLGYSWHAFTAWNNRWHGIIASNRALIRKHVTENSTWADALSVVNRD